LFKKQKKYDLANLEREIHNLTRLVQINGIINSTLDIVRLLTIIMEIIKEIMETEASTLLLYEEETDDLVFKVALGEAGDELVEKYRVKVGQGVAGWTAEMRKPVIVNDAYSDRRFDPEFDKVTGFRTGSILCSPLLYKGKLLGVIQAINPVNRPEFNDDDMRLFNVFAEQVALAVQNAIYFQKAIEEERMRIELESARSVQESLIPDTDMTVGDMRIVARSVPAREIGGEFQRIFRLGDDILAVSLGDIHEKGISGGLHASMVAGSLRAISMIGGKSPLKVVRTLRRAVLDDSNPSARLSIFYGIVDVTGRSVHFSNTGVAYPILLRDGVARYLRLGKIGEAAEDEDKSILVRLQPGDCFLVISDGILNIRNRSGKHLGLKRVMEFLQKDFADPAALVDSLVLFAGDYAGESGRKEDISIIAIKVS
jgi:sigma-B regulation protein RsbU (phosphoserine phosphatase)